MISFANLLTIILHVRAVVRSFQFIQSTGTSAQTYVYMLEKEWYFDFDDVVETELIKNFVQMKRCTIRVAKTAVMAAKTAVNLAAITAAKIAANATMIAMIAKTTAAVNRVRRTVRKTTVSE